MSQADQDQDKSMDKKEIAEEEREKMLNAENTKHTGAAPAPDLESEDHKPKKKIPIGGIKMPGFCRTKSKEPCKDDESKPTESTDTESAAVEAKDNEQHTPAAEKPTTPAKDSKEKEGRKGFLDAIRLPLVSVFPRKKNKDGDAELGTTGAAGLASVETLDDGGAEKNPMTNEDGMETVRLDGDNTDSVEPPKQHLLAICLSAARRNMFVLGATLCILLSVVIIICVACAGPRIVVQPLKDGKYVEAVTSCGLVQGVLEDGAYAFRGIPYAIPPVDVLRWQTAKHLDRIEHCWEGTYLAHNTSEMCWQRKASGQIDGVEDCLYLDVFTPEVRYDSPLPVVVMIGAETLSGASPGVMQPSAKLARVRDMVFVRPNFRLGIFGFLAAEPLSRVTHPPISGNYGLSDILAALKWVQLNIENFGGDKTSVTLWGHRAGGTLVTTLVGTKYSGLFSRAWISSGSAIFPGKELKKSEQLSEQFLQSIGCKDAACLRSKGAEDLMDAVPKTWHLSNVGLPETRETTTFRDRRHEWLVLDGEILKQHVGEIWAKNELPVKVVMGTTAHSGIPLRYLDTNATTFNSTQIEKIVRESLLGTTGLADETLRRYNSTLEGLVTMISDIRVICPLMTVARMKANIPFYVVTQSRGRFADPDSDAAAILGTYTATTPEEKRHVSAMQQLFNYYVWHGEIAQADPTGASRVLIVGQDTLLQHDYPNCKFWIEKDIVPSCGRID